MSLLFTALPAAMPTPAQGPHWTLVAAWPPQLRQDASESKQQLAALLQVPRACSFRRVDTPERAGGLRYEHPIRKYARSVPHA
eukprot:scaffold1769_cov128-Isochrysis_galbana.AAC.1